MEEEDKNVVCPFCLGHIKGSLAGLEKRTLFNTMQNILSAFGFQIIKKKHKK